MLRLSQYTSKGEMYIHRQEHSLGYLTTKQVLLSCSAQTYEREDVCVEAGAQPRLPHHQAGAPELQCSDL